MKNTSWSSSSSSGEPHLIDSLPLLKNKLVNEVQSLLSIFISPITTQVSDDQYRMRISEVTSILQQIKGTASSMMVTCQQMMAATTNYQPPIVFSETLDCYKEGDIIELDVAEILAKYTHYCPICGKGFKRDANLRMHMRAHGDEYKTTLSLTKTTIDDKGVTKKKYSCPQEGCRWNQRHTKFQPLKSIICAKNHYKRSHCPKMYVCRQCSRKRFSVLSDLRTHEKHCGYSKWQCSCGTMFSRKDKLMGHIALFIGHTPVFVRNKNRVSANDAEKELEQVLVYSDEGKGNLQ